MSKAMSLLIGWLFSVAAPLAILWGPQVVVMPDKGQQTAILATSIAFVLSYFAIKRLLGTYPGGRSAAFIAPQVIATYVLIALLTLLLRVEVSRLLLVSSGIAALIWFHVEYILNFRYRRPKLAIVQGGVACDLINLDDIDARLLRKLDLHGKRYDGVVADFSATTVDVERFLTTCALNRIPVYDAKAIYESFTGRVKINRMSENNIGALLPSPIFERIKTLLDWCMICVSLPVILPISLITALLIKIESPGPVIYTQTRIGLGNKPFKIYKFRSMRFDVEQTEQFAGEGDPRITRAGRVIRKLRIDELPQFWNVLKGDMSLIGPRPEQPSFVAQFDSQIPFYSYRHVVKPGITGWAQVRHGYAADADETQVKIEHDFYYIKNCSLSLDLFIIFLTIKTVLTGFGAR
ncbi:exopolysaccharide biosynthesis polyprenyl glycosylphosphotransferase [Allopusillimonas ginsengisoli]|uniref:exopolysaccharide biosynthesis polyprenyl glycosylphosphotransferase n=1 Tax=Allopusillimonas ginsengisoli TaxID=453575 RepID=UPI0039C0F2E6